jgi:hypothetical protein
MSEDWRARVDAVWAAATDENEAETVAAITALAAERPDDPVTLFELAGAHDYSGDEAGAEPLYRRALEGGLDEPYRGRAIIQLASTLRNLGRLDEAVALLTGFDDEHPLRDAASAFLALSLSSRAEHGAALATALDALARHLPEYGRSVRYYASELNP